MRPQCFGGGRCNYLGSGNQYRGHCCGDGDYYSGVQYAGDMKKVSGVGFQVSGILILN
jgi:hypothetical protein